MKYRLLSVLGVLIVGCSTGEAPSVGDAGGCWPPCLEGYTCLGGTCVEDYGCGEEFCLPPPGDEECNGTDDDRDGRVDESESGGPLAQWCQHSACGPGSQVCVDGRWTACHGRDPIAETGLLACDGFDNDCDGAVDEHPFVGGDVVFLVDRSGSMSGQLARLTASLTAFADSLGPEWRFAVVVFPGTSQEPTWEMWTDLVPRADVLPVLARVSAEPASGADEPSYDTLLAVATGEVPLSWRAGAARFVFLFTDEPGQSYIDPPVNETIACTAFTHGEVVVSYSYYRGDFNRCGDALGLAELDEIGAELTDPCR